HPFRRHRLVLSQRRRRSDIASFTFVGILADQAPFSKVDPASHGRPAITTIDCHRPKGRVRDRLRRSDTPTPRTTSDHGCPGSRYGNTWQLWISVPGPCGKLSSHVSPTNPSPTSACGSRWTSR